MDALVRPVRIPAQYVHYANKHSIFDIQKNLLKRLIIVRPIDPIEYLINYLKVEAVNIPTIFVLGPPCSGKNTIGSYISKCLNCVHIKAESVKKIENLFHDETIELDDMKNDVQNPYFLARALRDRLLQNDCETMGYILTGFPETESQARSLQFEGIFPEVVLSLKVTEKTVMERARDELVDPQTDDTYHRIFNPPSDRSILKRLVPPVDNSVQEIKNRLANFNHNFVYLEKIYSKILTSIDTEQPLANVYAQARCKLSRPVRNQGMWTPRVVLLGFSGSGRKSVAKHLQTEYDLIPVHCGTLIRTEIARESKLGLALTSYAENNVPVPDAMILKLLNLRLTEVDCTLKGWVLYGFPRSQIQAKLLDNENLEPNRIILLNIPHDEAAVRLNGRRVDSVTGIRYHLCHNPPPAELLNIPHRIGVTPGTTKCDISHNLARFAARRDELIKYYGERLIQVDADREMQTLFESVDSAITKQLPHQFYFP